jgi:T-complex protein 1 subunit theta
LFSGLPFESKVVCVQEKIETSSQFDMFKTQFSLFLQITILLHASSVQLCEEVKRSLEDGVYTVKALARNGKLVPGAGATELNVGISIREIAEKLEGVDQV